MTTTPRSYRMQARADGVDRTRQRAISAARARFFALAYDEVKLTDIAADAGVTTQTLLNHFGSKEGIAMAVAESLAPEIEALRGRVRVGDIDAAVRGLMRQYEALGDTNVRLAAVAERTPDLVAALGTARSAHRAWLEQVFAPYLPSEARDRRRMVAGLYAITDVGTWKLLRRDLGHSRADTAAVLQSLLRAALAATHTH